MGVETSTHGKGDTKANNSKLTILFKDKLSEQTSCLNIPGGDLSK